MQQHIQSLSKYMFTAATMQKVSKLAGPTLLSTKQVLAPALLLAPPVAAPPALLLAPPVLAPPVLAPPVLAPPVLVLAPTKLPTRVDKPFTPFQKDKLFWCFFIILNGYEEYEMSHSNSFTLEKQLKIETVEKLKSIKDQLKALKLKRTELEDELVNKPTITLKGLCALCLVHNVSVTYIYGRKYCDIIVPGEEVKKGIIIQNAKKEDSLKWTATEINSQTEDADFLQKLREEYWLIDITQIQKPLKASSAYTLSDLQDICHKLQIETNTTVNAKTKAKTKNKLYEEILQSV